MKKKIDWKTKAQKSAADWFAATVEIERLRNELDREVRTRLEMQAALHSAKKISAELSESNAAYNKLWAKNEELAGDVEFYEKMVESQRSLLIKLRVVAFNGVALAQQVMSTEINERDSWAERWLIRKHMRNLCVDWARLTQKAEAEFQVDQLRDDRICRAAS